MNFNSIKVRLELVVFTINQNVCFVFQFHKGTIRTIRKSSTTKTELIFQFHKGTIRTVTELGETLDFVRNFNSIKVRLEHRNLFPLLQSFCHFNSIKVRLEHTRAANTILNPIFQFHKGTIRTYTRFVNTLLSPLFQFHKGTIRTLWWALPALPIRYFNSIKVRLELVHDIGF